LCAIEDAFEQHENACLKSDKLDAAQSRIVQSDDLSSLCSLVHLKPLGKLQKNNFPDAAPTLYERSRGTSRRLHHPFKEKT
jgi:hypothetical protein